MFAVIDWCVACVLVTVGWLVVVVYLFVAVGCIWVIDAGALLGMVVVLALFLFCLVCLYSVHCLCLIG